MEWLERKQEKKTKKSNSQNKSYSLKFFSDSQFYIYYKEYTHIGKYISFYLKNTVHG